MANPPRIRRGNEAAVPDPAPAAAQPSAAVEVLARPVMRGDDTLSPVDLPGSTTIGGRPLLWTSVTIYLAAAFLALTNATAIHGWAVELAPTPLTARIVAITEGWQALTAPLGTPRAVMHGWWTQAQDARFGDERR